MIAVIGSPVGRRSTVGLRAAGLPVAIARAIVAAGATAQLVGKLGEGGDADAVALSLAADGIGHVALQRAPGPLVVVDDEARDVEGALDQLAGLDQSEAATIVGSSDPSGASLDAADLELALRYLPDYRVVVLAQALDALASGAVREAARWAGAQLIEVTAPGVGAMTSFDDATVFEAPTEDAEGAFASLVGRYAAALDAGTSPADAFATASAAVGWAAVSD